MRVALVSDTHLDSRDAMLLENWRTVEVWLRALAPDLIVHLGDISANGWKDAAQLSFAHRALTRSGLPIRAIPGNHDIGDSPIAPGLRPDEPLVPERLADYRRLFGPDRWLIEADGWRFVGLNALLLATGRDEEERQFHWLARSLARGRGPIGVFLHKPLFRDHPDEDNAHLRYVAKAARQRLASIWSEHDVRFVASGHTHQLRRHRHDGIDYAWAPSTAFTVPDSRQEWIGVKRVGVLVLDTGAAGHEFTHLVPEGMTAYCLTDFPHVYPALVEECRQVS